MRTKEKLQEDLVDAMRTGNNNRRDTLRLLLAAIKQVEVDDQVELDEAGLQAVMARQAKQRRESIADAESAGRIDLVKIEQQELELISAYLPKQMSEAQVRETAMEVIAVSGASSIADMGRVMGQLMPKVKGKADGRLVSEVVRSLLSG